jgi:hypothetical protein
MAGLTQLYDPEFLFRSNTFTSFVITWLIRYADPRRTHPKPIVEYVLASPRFFISSLTPFVTDFPFPRKYL